MKKNFFILLLILSCFSCKQAEKEQVTKKTHETSASLTNDDINEVLQDSLDMVFNAALNFEPNTRAEYLQKNIDRLLDSTIKESFSLKYDAESFDDIALEFAKDTFRINETISISQVRDYSTLRMQLCNSYLDEVEKRLIDKCFKKLLSVLDKKNRAVLIENQKQWNESYQSNRRLYANLLSEQEGTLYSILRLADAEQRYLFLFNCYNLALSAKFHKEINMITYSDSILGDFNGDGKKEYAWYVSKGTKWAIEKDSLNYIEFSDSTIPRIFTNHWFAPRLINETDLNNDGKDEIGAIIYTNPEEGNWHEYCVWTLHNGRWKELIKPFTVFVGRTDMVDLVKAHPTDKNKVIILYNEFEDIEGVISKEKCILIE